ncbi:ATP-dependent helicase [Beijerinckia sp. L45]|uniref:ATP-dependent helicase n=1 Tax=Beijerinckia sp. L45 TaxID=1641855 RepID=UPI00131BF850|nr:UvrD-helicase domain-containing protein [Beijerinckia sp. L45]
MALPSSLDDAGLDEVTPRAGGIADRARARQGESRYLDGLNPEQRAGVEAIDGPVLVLAGAGTGKTRVLTTRIAHILASSRARAHEILAVTFTNKAAREMKERVAMLAGPVAEGMPWLGTFHAISTKILRRHAELVGLKSGFTILDTDDQIRLMKQVIQAAGIDDKRWPARALANQIDAWKNRGLGPPQVPAGEGSSFANGKGIELYRAYQERLKTLNATDFGDLLLECVRLFREHPDILKTYQERFRFMLVDEYQDTNTVQYLWLKLLAQGRHNVCCVGDDDQSIYGWRGAEVDNILRFEKDFPGAKVIRLEQNYRSTGHILATAAHLIARNEGRLGKTLFTDGEDGEKTTVTGIWDSEEEARTVGESIEQLQRQGHTLDEVAILVRASFQMREFEERFITLGLPYRVIGGPRFYERAEIRDALAYLRCVAQPADDLAFERIFNNPKRGLGDATLQLLHEYARRERIPLIQAARVMVETEELKPKQRQTLRALVADFARWSSLIDSKPQGQLAEMILDESGYTAMWQKDRTAEAAGRLENLKELVRSMEEFPDLTGFLEHISLVMEAADKGTGERVSIMTLHAAKGLEFETVFLPGWEEGLFPHQRSLDESGRAGLEEERRLAYVGITRAKRRAKIYFATNRRIHGLWQTTIPSRFLDELPEKHVEVTEAANGNAYGGYAQSRFANMDSYTSTYSTPGWQRAQRRNESQPSGNAGGFGQQSARRGPLQIEGDLVAKSSVGSAFAKGIRVFHQKFGNGVVASVDGNKLTVDFDKAGRKMVLDSFLSAT